MSYCPELRETSQWRSAVAAGEQYGKHSAAAINQWESMLEDATMWTSLDQECKVHVHSKLVQAYVTIANMNKKNNESASLDAVRKVLEHEHAAQQLHDERATLISRQSPDHYPSIYKMAAIMAWVVGRPEDVEEAIDTYRLHNNFVAYNTLDSSGLGKCRSQLLAKRARFQGRKTLRPELIGPVWQGFPPAPELKLGVKSILPYHSDEGRVFGVKRALTIDDLKPSGKEKGEAPGTCVGGQCDGSSQRPSVIPRNPLWFREKSSFVVVMRKAFVKRGVIWNGKCTLFPFQHDIVLKDMDWKHSRKADHKLKFAFYVPNMWPNNYHHFLVEVLAGIAHGCRVLKTFPEAKLLVTADQSRAWFARPLIQATLQQCGVPISRLAMYSPTRNIRVKKLMVMYWVDPHNVPTEYRASSAKTADGSAAKKLPLTRHRELVSAHYPPRAAYRSLAKVFQTTMKYNERRMVVYLSRSTRKYRAVRDEKPLVDALRRLLGPDVFVYHGYHDRDSLRIGGQVELFRKTRIMLGPHGAGMSNMVFTGCGAKLIEFPIFPDVHNYFGYMMSALGNQREYYVVPEVSARYYGAYTLGPGAVDKVVELVRLLYNAPPPPGCS